MAGSEFQPVLKAKDDVIAVNKAQLAEKERIIAALKTAPSKDASEAGLFRLKENIKITGENHAVQ